MLPQQYQLIAIPIATQQNPRFVQVIGNSNQICEIRNQPSQSQRELNYIHFFLFFVCDGIFIQYYHKGEKTTRRAFSKVIA